MFAKVIVFLTALAAVHAVGLGVGGPLLAGGPLGAFSASTAINHVAPAAPLGYAGALGYGHGGFAGAYGGLAGAYGHGLAGAYGGLAGAYGGLAGAYGHGLAGAPLAYGHGYGLGARYGLGLGHGVAKF